MDALAGTPDLAVRKVDIPDETLATIMLDVASDEIRLAAGTPISQVTSTIRYDGWRDVRMLTLAGPPVTAVSSVTIDGTAVTDWRLLASGRLWRRCGWGTDDGPADVRVTQTHGLALVPKSIVDLACQLAAAGMAAAVENGYVPRTGLASEQTPEYSVAYAQGAEAIAKIMGAADHTRDWLRGMFGGSAEMVTTRS